MRGIVLDLAMTKTKTYDLPSKPVVTTSWHIISLLSPIWRWLYTKDYHNIETEAFKQDIQTILNGVGYISLFNSNLACVLDRHVPGFIIRTNIYYADPVVIVDWWGISFMKHLLSCLWTYESIKTSSFIHYIIRIYDEVNRGITAAIILCSIWHAGSYYSD